MTQAHKPLFVLGCPDDKDSLSRLVIFLKPVVRVGATVVLVDGWIDGLQVLVDLVPT
jgi:hypothetical protein